ncbi:TIM barrel protein [Palleronia pelagia]|uniref:2-keto-myo-inositol isomerase n=1 Tax=Palleronia pelagia TaxID=387096 RepID=A0A1H8AGX7_9RHOB|nr:TIM barrel protein [Palleronia pelagia]SEM69736.1 2-keto-myo-inositol isomerase [Palleronia pelagia]
MPDAELIQFALNQKTLPETPFLAFLDLAADLGCVGVEARIDLGRPLFDGLPAAEAGDRIRERGLRLVGISEVFPFKDWTEERRALTKSLLRSASEAGAETISLIPRVDGKGPSMFGSPARHQDIVSQILSMTDDHDISLLIEPIGFPGSSIRFHSEVADCISQLDASDRVGILHDTFQHSLSGDGEILVEHLRHVHISGLPDGRGPLTEADDAKRVLIDENDRTGAARQISHLITKGYRGPFSFEATARDARYRENPHTSISASMAFLRDFSK